MFIKKIKIFFLYTLILLAFFMALAVILIQTDYFREKIRGYLENTISKQINGELYIESITGNIFRDPQLHNIRIKTDSVEMISISKLSIDYSFQSIFDRTFKIRSFHIEDAEFSVSKDGNDLVDIFKPENNSSSPPGRRGINVKSLEVSQSSIFHENEIIDEVNLRSSLLIEDEAVDVQVDKMGFRYLFDFISSGRVKYRDDELKFYDFRIDAGSSKVKVDGDVKNLSNPVFELIVSLDYVDLEEIKKIHPDLTIGGSAEGKLEISGPYDNPAIIHDIKYEEALFSGKSIVMEDYKVEMEGSVKKLNPNIIWRSAPEGNLNLSYIAKAIFSEERKIDLAVFLEESSINSTNIESGKIKAYITQEEFTVYESDLNVFEGIVFFQGSGRIGEELSGKISLKDISLKPITEGRVTGRLSFDSELSGNISEEAVSGNIFLKESVVEGVVLDDGFVGFSYKNEKLNIKEIKLLSRAGRFSAAGELSSVSLKGDFKGNVEDVSRFISIREKEVRGKVEFSGSVSGSLSEPELLISAEFQDFIWDNINAENIFVDANVKGEPLDSRGIFKVKAERFNLADEVFELAEIFIEKDEEKGRLSLQATSSGRSYEVKASFLEKLTFMRLEKFLISTPEGDWRTPSEYMITYKDGVLESEMFSIKGPDEGYMNIYGAVEPKSGKVNVNVNAEGVQIKKWAELFRQETVLNGVFFSEIEISGTFEEPQVVSSLLTEGFCLGKSEFEYMKAGFDYSENNLEFKSEVVKEGESAQVQGNMPLRISFFPFYYELLDELFDVSVRAEGLKLDFLEELSESIVHSKGRLDINVDIMGTPVEPVYYGSFYLSDATVALRQAGTPYKNINAEAVFREDRFEIKTMTARSGDGTGRVDGKISLSQGSISEIDLNFKAERFLLARTPEYSGVINCDIDFRGKPDESYVSGRMTVLRSEVNVAPPRREMARGIEIVDYRKEGTFEITERSQRMSEVFSGLIIDLEVNIPGNSWIRWEGMESEARGNLRLRRFRNGEILIDGRVNLVRGTFRRAGIELTIERGALIFAGPLREARVEVSSVRRFPNVVVYLIISGTVESPNIELTSNPIMDESNIISYLVFGKPVEELTQLQMRSLPETAGGVLGMAAERGVREILGPRLAPDIIEIRPLDRGTIGIAKYITDRLFVKYEWRMVEHESPWTVAEYMISPNLNIRSIFGNPKMSGVDFLWNFSY